MMGEEVFQLHVATPTYATRSMSLYKARQETSSTGSSFPTGAQQGLLPLLGANESSFPADASSTLKFCHGN